MRVRTVLGAVLIAVAVGVPGAVAAQASSQGAAPECATVTVKPRPVLNTAMIPETITSTVTSCAPATETVVLDQHISGPTNAGRDKIYTITLTAGQTKTKTRSFPYACCGSYRVRDTVRTQSGTLLARTSAGFTFA
jgi:hypothetical protein